MRETKREAIDAEGARGDAASRTGRVVDLVRAHIREGRLRPGDALPGEAAFALRAGVSRPVAREAFRSLAALGIVDTGNGRRPRVARVDSGVLGAVIDHAVTTDQMSPQQIFDVRRTVEGRIVALAAMRRAEEEARAIAEEAEGMRAAFDDPPAVMEHDLAFHRRLATASRNPLFALLIEGFAEATRQTWAVAWRARASDAERLESVETHRAVAAAVAAQDAGAAVAAMNDHFDHSVRALLAAGMR